LETVTRHQKPKFLRNKIDSISEANGPLNEYHKTMSAGIDEVEV
jgi:hypothetical protein